jgi:hypothetical protein
MAEEVIQRTITQAPDYLKPGIEKFLEGATLQAGQALDTSKFAPQVAGLGALQQNVQQQLATQAGLGTLQFGPQGQVTGVTGTGVSQFQPFLTAAQTGISDAQKQLAEQAKLIGPQAFTAFQSPYQTAVRDATLKQFEESRKQRRQGISDEAAKLGALGAGRTGVQLAEYDRKTDMDKALLLAQLNQSGFTQAQDLASRAFGQRGQLASSELGLGQASLGLGEAQQGLRGAELGIAQGLGQSDLAFRQALLDQTQGANRLAAFEPVDRLARFGQGLTGVGGMMGSVQTTMGTPPPQTSALGGALQAGIGAFTLGKLFG